MNQHQHEEMKMKMQTLFFPVKFDCNSNMSLVLCFKRYVSKNIWGSSLQRAPTQSLNRQHTTYWFSLTAMPIERNQAKIITDQVDTGRMTLWCLVRTGEGGVRQEGNFLNQSFPWQMWEEMLMHEPDYCEPDKRHMNSCNRITRQAEEAKTIKPQLRWHRSQNVSS